MKLLQLLQRARALQASDLHLSAGSSPAVRVNGRLLFLEEEAPLTAEETAVMTSGIMDRRSRLEYEERGEADFVLTWWGCCRCRVNVYRRQGSAAAAIRLLREHTPSCAELGLPAGAVRMAELEHGLVLVSGPAGSGKSTTLAALVDKINSERSCHIITLEDPVEFIHGSRRSLVSQREAGRDTADFASGIRSALREDPDVILVGELRDWETISAALLAAETGHLVLATLHTGDAAGTVDRILDACPGGREQAGCLLASCLQGIICQQLLPRASGGGRAAAFEVLIATEALRSLIRDGRTHQLHSYIQTGSRLGMMTMADCREKLRREGVITGM